MGHNSWIARVERIEAAQRAEASAELIADAVALVDKWNADSEIRFTESKILLRRQ